MSIGLTILVIFLCVLGEAFFAGSEIALISMDKIHLRHLAKNGVRGAIRLQELLNRPEWLLGTTLVGTNICVVINTTLASSLFYNYFGSRGVILSILTVATVNWILAEIVPKSIFQYYADKIALKVSFPLYFFSILLYPIIWVFAKVGSILATLLGGKVTSKLPFFTRDELKLLMKIVGEKSDIKSSERKMIDRLLSFKELTAGDVMVPLIKVTLINEDSTVEEARKLIANEKHRRLPVYRERVDQICGMIFSFDILGEEPNQPIKNFIRPAYFIPSSMMVTTLLEQFQRSGNNMAIVVDEYGGAEGIVTVEDILEEIVGEIGDEFDLNQPWYQIQRDASIIVNGQTSISEINEKFQLNLPEGDYETINGYLIAQMGKIPQAGDRFKTEKALFIVTRSTPSKVLEVKIKLLN